MIFVSTIFGTTLKFRRDIYLVQYVKNIAHLVVNFSGPHQSERGVHVVVREEISRSELLRSVEGQLIQRRRRRLRGASVRACIQPRPRVVIRTARIFPGDGLPDIERSTCVIQIQR